MQTNAQVTWVDGMQFVGMGKSGHAIVMDASKEGGGYGSAPGPMEVMLMGILGCTAMDVISILKKKRQPVMAFKVTAEGERSDEHPMKYTKIHIEYIAYGDVDLKALARAVELSETTYCGAMATVRGVAEITHSMRVEPAAR